MVGLVGGVGRISGCAARPFRPGLPGAARVRDPFPFWWGTADAGGRGAGGRGPAPRNLLVRIF
ncbi:hypothetical protein HMPREF1317_1921 [Schaalia georgiae F0490]|uniref:Uncharacterized protein n=1 Tax=Schaalia georgiae F0490 TaxID=1125717 RepID=J0N490_9ACTO|nr:hypothetical protein HMPREF1317_1921 [Schaalia georgiae F0490]